MVTTIQLDENIKEQLTEIARKLELDLKEKFTYNDVIKYLLQNFPINLDKTQLISLRGIISYNKAKESLKELKELDKERERHFEK